MHIKMLQIYCAALVCLTCLVRVVDQYFQPLNLMRQEKGGNECFQRVRNRMNLVCLGADRFKVKLTPFAQDRFFQSVWIVEVFIWRLLTGHHFHQGRFKVFSWWRARFGTAELCKVRCVDKGQ